jgi:hypothetical protein
MPLRFDQKILQSDLVLPWIVTGIMLFMLVAYIVVCLNIGEGSLITQPEALRVKIRTLLYALAIVIFPVTNLIRHIQLKLNQTMPYNQHYRAVAKTRYLVTVIISMSLIETIAIFGFVMYLIGDGYNNFFIFIGMSALGMFLYRPKETEYEQIVEALKNQRHE